MLRASGRNIVSVKWLTQAVESRIMLLAPRTYATVTSSSKSSTKKLVTMVSEPSNLPSTRRQFLWTTYYTAIQDNRLLLILQHNNLTVGEQHSLSRELKKFDGQFKVVKSSILAAALSQTIYGNLSSLILGPIAIITSNKSGNELPAQLGSILGILNKNKKIFLLGGKLDDSLLNVEDLTKVATLPGLGNMQAELLGLIGAPARKILEVLKRPGSGVIMTLAQYERQLKGAS